MEQKIIIINDSKLIQIAKNMWEEQMVLYVKICLRHSSVENCKELLLVVRLKTTGRITLKYILKVRDDLLCG